MARSLKYTWAASRYVLGTDDGYRVRFDVTCADGMPAAVFAYRLLPMDPQTGAKAGHFSHICSPVDLEEYPINGPIPGHVPEWFRLSYVDVELRSVTEAEAFVRDVRADLARLVRSLQRLDAITPTGEEELGAICPTDSSSSSAAAPSSSSASSSASLGALMSLRAVSTLARGIANGLPWTDIGTGAASEVGSSDSMSGTASYNRARATLGPGQAGQLLLLQGFDFSAIPEAATIEGVRARVWARDATAGPASSASAGSSSPEDPELYYLRLYHPDAGPVGTNKAAPPTALTGPGWTPMTAGGPADLWGAVLTAADVRRGDFGVALLFKAGDDVGAVVEVDGAELWVYYRSQA